MEGNRVLIVLKVLVIFLIIYLFLFGLTFILTKIAQNINIILKAIDEYNNRVIMKSVTKLRALPVNKKWNDVLGVWEIEK